MAGTLTMMLYDSGLYFGPGVYYKFWQWRSEGDGKQCSRKRGQPLKKNVKVMFFGF